MLSRILGAVRVVRIGSFWSRNYIEYESNSVRNKTLLIEEHLMKLDHI